MVEKYRTHLNDIYEFIQNNIQIGHKPEYVTNQVMSKYNPQIFFPESKDTVWDMVYILCEQAYYYVNRTYYKV